MQNQWSFRTKSRLKAIDNSVKVSQVIGKKNASGNPFYPSFTDEIVVLVSEDKRTYETTKASADGLGNVTFSLRGLADDGSETEVVKFKRAWMPGTLMFVTIGSQTIEGKADVDDLGAVAFSNDYNDLDNILTAGANITIDGNNEISAVDTTYTAGTGIDITAGVISSTQTSGERGQITGDIQDQTDLQTALSGKQDTLTAGSNIDITSNVISATDTTYTASDFDIKDLADSTSLRSAWSGKQDAISDLSTIRSGASAGATAVQPGDIGTAAACNTGTSSGNVPVLDANGKLNTTILPAIAITDTFTVATASDLTSLSSAEKGDIAVATTDNETYILSADPYSTAANWIKLATPTDAVSSVNSKTGAVTLDADDIDDTTTTHKFVTASDLTILSNTSGTNTGDQTASDFDIKDLADSTSKMTGWDAKLDSGDNVSELVNDAGYLTSVPALNTQVIKIDIATGNSTSQKTATKAGYTPTAGDLILAHFLYGNSANNVTLNINNTGNKYIRLGGTIANANNFSIPNQTDMYAFLMYNGYSYNAYATDNTKYSASDFDIKNLADSTSLRTQWSGKQDKFYTKSSSAPVSPSEGDEWYDTTNDILKVYDGSNWIEVGSGSGDMMYSDFNWTTLTGASVDLALASKITPSANFTVNAPSTIKDGQVYVLRVENGATAYTMTLGTNITNPSSTDLTLTANATDMFVFMAVGGNLELQPSDADTTYTAGTGISITSGVIANTGVTSVNGSTGAVSVPTGDVTGPGSSTDGHLAVFDGATGKTIKDGGAIPTVNDATLTISQGGVTKQTFSANASSNVTAELNTSFIMDEDDYTALPSSKESDGNFYFIFEDDEA